MPKLGRCGVPCSMGKSRKQIAFDLSHEALRQHYPHRETVQDPQFFKRAYKDIQRFMDANGFERRQHSVYVSTEELTTLDVAVLIRRMASQLPWLGQCAEKVDTTDIGAQHSLLGLLRPHAQLDVSIDRQATEELSRYQKLIPAKQPKRQKKRSLER